MRSALLLQCLFALILTGVAQGRIFGLPPEKEAAVHALIDRIEAEVSGEELVRILTHPKDDVEAMYDVKWFAMARLGIIGYVAARPLIESLCQQFRQQAKEKKLPGMQVLRVTPIDPCAGSLALLELHALPPEEAVRVLFEEMPERRYPMLNMTSLISHISESIMLPHGLKYLESEDREPKGYMIDWLVRRGDSHYAQHLRKVLGTEDEGTLVAAILEYVEREKKEPRWMLELLAEHVENPGPRPKTLVELHEKLGLTLPKGPSPRAMEALRQRGYVIEEENGRYRIKARPPVPPDDPDPPGKGKDEAPGQEKKEGK